jgi:outer membrane protein assembly factor BamD
MRTVSTRKRDGVWLLLAVVLVGCASTKPEGELTGTIGSLYNDGMDALQQGRYQAAVHHFSELERQYPYSGWATRAQIMEAYTQFKAGNHEESNQVLERFIKQNPGHPDLGYAYYLQGLNHYYRLTDVMRDQTQTRAARDAFQEVVNRFPQSKYAQDAKLKLTLTEDHLAGREMVVGRFYQQQQQYLAAMNRFKTVVKEYQTTAQAPEALYRLIECYLALGVADEAQRAGAILGYNYASSDWYAKGYDLLTGNHLAPQGQRTTWAQQLKRGLEDLF